VCTRVGVCLARLPAKLRRSAGRARRSPESAPVRRRTLSKRAAISLVVLPTALFFVVFYAIGRWGGSPPEPAHAEVSGQALGDAELPPLPSLHALPALRAGRAPRSTHARSRGATSRSGSGAGGLPQGPAGPPEGVQGHAETPAPASNAPVAAQTAPEAPPPPPHVSTIGTVDK
jgi:hypothetical protein